MRTASLAELEDARDDAIVIVQSLNSLPRLLSLLPIEVKDEGTSLVEELPQDEALLQCTLLNIARRHVNPDEYHQSMRTVRAMNALLALLDRVPRELRDIYFTDKPLELTAEQWQQHDEIRRKFQAEFPTESAVLPYHSE